MGGSGGSITVRQGDPVLSFPYPRVRLSGWRAGGHGLAELWNSIGKRCPEVTV